jgi:uncharacterized protein
MRRITFHIAKNLINIAKHDMPMTVTIGMDWTTAWVREDLRFAYGEQRFGALGFIGRRLHALIFTVRDGELRVISVRKANARERKAYHEQASPSAGRL